MNQIEYAIIVILAIYICALFIRMRDGMLRKLMILYFLLVAIEHGLEWLYYSVGYLHDWSETKMLAIAHFPKVIAMVLLALYLMGKQRENKKNITVN